MGIIQERVESSNFVTITADKLFNWSRLSSLWLLVYGIACCGIELMAAGTTRYDFDRYGIVPRATPRQADLLVIAGPVVKKMVPVLKTLYAQMPEPKYVISMGTCAVSGGAFRDSHNVLRGGHKAIPVDVFVPGCHPRPEGLLYGILMLQDMMSKESFLDSKKKLAANPIIVPENISKEEIIAKAEED
ncbi:MAG TPA: NADH-quinone oxidoreductase subunit B [Actinobacteria bacterium]|nr:NADH-quinone oxidoreductase subunit B [Actinomycetota bacterium]